MKLKIQCIWAFSFNLFISISIYSCQYHQVINWFWCFMYFYFLDKVLSNTIIILLIHRSPSDCMSPQVCRTLLSILADSTNAVVWRASTRPILSKSSNPRTNPLVTVSSVSVTISVIVTNMFHSFFQFSSKV